MLACDFCVTVTAGFRLVDVFLVLEVGTRRILHWTATEHPTSDWKVQQFRAAITGGRAPVSRAQSRCHLRAGIRLPVGRHVIDAINTSLGYKTSTAVQVSAGAVARLRLQMPLGTLNINALPWADVAVDGRKLGTTPLGNVSLPIGAHEIVFNHPQLGERRQRVTVTRNAVNRVSVDFNQR